MVHGNGCHSQSAPAVVLHRVPRRQGGASDPCVTVRPSRRGGPPPPGRPDRPPRSESRPGPRLLTRRPAAPGSMGRRRLPGCRASDATSAQAGRAVRAPDAMASQSLRIAECGEWPGMRRSLAPAPCQSAARHWHAHAPETGVVWDFSRPFHPPPGQRRGRKGCRPPAPTPKLFCVRRRHRVAGSCTRRQTSKPPPEGPPGRRRLCPRCLSLSETDSNNSM